MTKLNRKEWWVYQGVAAGFAALGLLLIYIVSLRLDTQMRFPVTFLAPVIIAYIADMRRAADTDLALDLSLLISVSYSLSIVTFLIIDTWSWAFFIQLFLFRAIFMVILGAFPSNSHQNQLIFDV